MNKSNPWMRWVLRISGLCHLAGGSWLASHGSPMLGFPVGVMGLGQMLASLDPLRNWVIILLSLLMLLGQAWISQSLYLVAGFVICLIPFSMMLFKIHQVFRTKRILASPEIQRFALRAKTQYGVSLLEMSELSPTLIVFLRHLGCTFCRETLADLGRQRAQIERDGVRVALVHMASEAHAEPFLEKYNLGDLPRVSDPGQAVYRAFGLERGSLIQLFGLKTWVRGFRTAFVDGHGQGPTVGDSFQMPGVFLIFHGEVLRAYRHQSPADRPDYVSLAESQDYPIPS